MAQGLKKTSKVARKTKNITKRQRTAAAKKTVKKTIKDQVRSGASLPCRASVAARHRCAAAPYRGAVSRRGAPSDGARRRRPAAPDDSSAPRSLSDRVPSRR